MAAYTPLGRNRGYRPKMAIVLLLLGIALLFGGGELLVRNASLLARAWGMAPMVVGLTVVAFGTSSPELAASLTAALNGSAEIALGNVVGSNIANVALILGVTALIAPLRTEARFLRREMPIMIGVSVLLAVVAANGSIGRLEGVLFVVLLAGYLLVLFRGDEEPAVSDEFEREYGDPSTVPAWRAGSGAVAGLVVLVVGARLLVDGATEIARGMGVPELIIGVTVVALGTSLPELVTSAIAAAKGEPDLALGNIIGSNVFNVLAILGITVLVQPITVPFARVAPDMWVMLGTSLLLWPFLFTGWRLGRREGAALLLAYVAYVAWRFAA